MNAISPTTMHAADALADALAELEEDIVFGRLHPRQRLTEDELMERFGLAPRGAPDPAELEALGAVEKKRNMRLAREVMELYALRQVLEVHAASQIPSAAGAAGGAGGRAAQTRCGGRRRRRAPRVPQQPRAFIASFSACWTTRCWARPSRNTRAAPIPSASARWHRPAIANARQEHWAMIHALRDGDRDALMALCRDHLLPSRDAYLASERPGSGPRPPLPI